MKNKKIVYSEEKEDIYRKIATNPDPSTVISFMQFPRSFKGKLNLSNLLKINDAYDCDVKKVIAYEIIWCTGNEIVYEFDVNCPADLDREDIHADYAHVVMFEEQRVLFVYSRF